MTDGSLPEGLVERSIAAADEALGRHLRYAEIRTITDAVLAVAAPALRERALREAGKTSVAWLIEDWRSGRCVGYWNTSPGWSMDQSYAVRFARREDAERVIYGLLRLTDPGADPRAAEHAWEAP